MRARVMSWGVGLMLAVSATLAAGQPSCRRPLANAENGGEPFTISSTPVMVLRANTSRCSALIYNSSANGMMCRDAADGVVTATAGTPIPAGQSLTLGLESQGQWRCVRSGGADATAYVTEGRP